MRNAPVFYTLAQIRFNPVALMSEFVPKIQDRLRRAGFPDFRTDMQQRIDLRQVNDQPSVNVLEIPRWVFENSKGSEGYILDEHAIVYHTTAYDTFATFSDRLLMGFALVHEVAQLAYTERIGLRYLDAVVPKDGLELKAYLKESVLGLHTCLEGALQHTVSETVIKNSCGTLVTRVVIRDGKLAYPADLRANTLKTAEKFKIVKGRHAVLDNDHYTDERVDLDIHEVRTRLDLMHTSIEEAFNATVTNFALDHWK